MVACEAAHTEKEQDRLGQGFFFSLLTQDGARMGAVRNARGFGAAAHR